MSISRHVCRPKRLILLYLAGFTFVLIYIIVNIGSICPSVAEEQDKSRFQEDEALVQQRQIALQQFEQELNRRELLLKQLYPEAVEHINQALNPDMPFIYAITPTYTRPVQKAELTRLMNTFRLVPNFHWIVVEDSSTKTGLVEKLLANSGLPHTHLNALTPAKFKMKSSDPNWLKPRGVVQRNAGLRWLRGHLAEPGTRGVLYFADDDNTYDMELFKEMRYTTKAAVWPVGLVGYLRYERPIVTAGKVTGWFTYWHPDRAFAMDMAGFCLNAQLLLDYPEAEFSNEVLRGELESGLLTKFGLTLNDLEPKADQCTKILVWHTRTEKPNMKNEDKLKAMGKAGSDMGIEV